MNGRCWVRAYVCEKIRVPPPPPPGGLGGDTFTRKYIIWVKVTGNVAQYPLHHVTYTATKFEVARSYGLGGDTFTRNVTDAQTGGHTGGRLTDFGMKLIYSFSIEKAGIKMTLSTAQHIQGPNKKQQKHRLI